jgi:LPS-assembly protein
LTGDEGPAAREGRLDDNGTELEFRCLRERLYFPEALSDACGVTAADKRGQGDRTFQDGEREARDRLSIFPRISLGGTLADAVSLSAFAGYRQSLWLGEVTGRTWQRGYPLLGVRAEAELGRTFDGGLRHAITPMVDVRAVPAVIRGSNNATPEPVPYDDVDRSISSTPAGVPAARIQAVGELRQRLTRPGSAGPVFRFDLGQGLELLAPERVSPALAETYGRAGVSVGWVNASATARVDPVTPRLSRLSVTGAVDDGRGHGAYATFDHLLDDGNNRTRSPIDLLFGPQVPAWLRTRSTMLSVGGRWQFASVGVRYDALFLERPWGAVKRLSLTQHTVGVSWAPACDCWRLELFATQRLRDDGTYGFPDVGATLTVSRLGSIGVGQGSFVSP